MSNGNKKNIRVEIKEIIRHICDNYDDKKSLDYYDIYIYMNGIRGAWHNGINVVGDNT